MGGTVSSLVFRPPRPTPIHPSEYFYLDVDVHSPLCTNRPRKSNECGDEHGGCGAMCLDAGESDLASLDAGFVANDSAGCTGCGSSVQRPSGTVPNMRNGQVYKIPAFFIRRRNATQTLLFSHGNAEDLGMMYGRMKDLAMILGVNVMAYDYTGYGLSIPGPAHGSSAGSNVGGGNSGEKGHEGPTENMVYRNIEAAFHYLVKVRKIPPQQIILYGRSLGSAPSCYLAAKTALKGESVGGLILHSPFLSVYKVVADLNGLDMGMVGDLFHNEKRAKNVRCPTLIIHGKQDEVVPFWHAPRLLASIPPEFRAQPFYVDGLGHNHIESKCRDQYVQVVTNFLRMGAWQSQSPRAASPRSDVPTHRGPKPLPLHERATPSETKENSSFYVNKTWLRHAKVLLRDVLCDGGCYGGGSSTVADSRSDRRWEKRGQRSSSVPRSAMGRNSPAANEMNRYNNGFSDARDDVDEFAPWRAGGRIRSASPNNVVSSSMPSNFQRHASQRAPQHHRAQSEKIVYSPKGSAKRPNSPSHWRSFSPSAGNGSPASATIRKYHRAGSMTAIDGRLDEFLVKSNMERQQQPGSPQSTRRLQASMTRQAGYGKSKSMNLLDGLSRQKRI
ncbi:hypothetical protein ACHAXT_009459 [Thalassiosira profunda]